MQFVNVTLLSIFLILISSCSTTVDFEIPSNRFVTAEAGEELLNTNLGVYYGRSKNYELATLYGPTIFSNSTSYSEEHGIFDSVGLGYNIGVTLAKSVDVIIYDFHDAAFMVGGKWQFLGEGKSAVGHKAAIQLAVGSTSENDQTLNIQNQNKTTTNKYSATLDVEAFEATMLYSYRFNPYLLAYLNFTFSSYNTEAKLHGDSVSDENLSLDVISYISLLGLEIASDGKKNTGLRVESGYVNSKTSDKQRANDIPLGLQWFFRW